MRLSELQPKWIGLNPGDWGGTERSVRFGVRFLCPHCRTQRIGFLFKPFIDPDNFAWKVAWAIPGAPDPNTGAPDPVLFWDRQAGEDFETLTISPSVDISVAGHWHGHIVSGEIR